jgi:hypothetical protein
MSDLARLAFSRPMLRGSGVPEFMTFGICYKGGGVYVCSMPVRAFLILHPRRVIGNAVNQITLVAMGP